MTTLNLENPKCKKCKKEKPVWNFNTSFEYCDCEKPANEN